MSYSKKSMKKFGILSAYGYLWIHASSKEEAENIFRKDYDIEKYPVKRIRKKI